VTISTSALETLLGGYLHEDWGDDYATARDAIDQFARIEHDHAPALRAEVDEVIRRSSSDSELRVRLRRLGLVYRIRFDGWMSHRDWLLAVADQVEEVLLTAPLEQFFGGYLNEDWADDYSDPWEAVDDFVHCQPSYALRLRSAIEAIVREYPAQDVLEIRLIRMGLGYRIQFHGWTSHRDWLMAVADRVDEVLRTTPAA